jgi:hypothetical protein
VPGQQAGHRRALTSAGVSGARTRTVPIPKSISQRRSAVNGSDAIEMSRSPFPDPRVDQPPDLPSAGGGLPLPRRVGAGIRRFRRVGAIHRGQQGEERADS